MTKKKYDTPARQPGDLYLATLDAKYELSAVGATPKEAMTLLHRHWVAWWKNDPYGGDGYTWKEHVEGSNVSLRIIRAGKAYVDGGAIESSGETWAWNPDHLDGTSDYTKVEP